MTAPSKFPLGGRRRIKATWETPVLKMAALKDITRGNGISGHDGHSANPRS